MKRSALQNKRVRVLRKAIGTFKNQDPALSWAALLGCMCGWPIRLVISCKWIAPFHSSQSTLQILVHDIIRDAHECISEIPTAVQMKTWGHKVTSS